MLGFSSISETGFSEASVSLDTNAFLSTLLASLSQNDFSLNALANVTMSAATVSGIAAAFSDVDAQALTSISSVTASFSVESPHEYAEANITPNAATASFTAQAFSDVDAQAVTTLTATSFNIHNGGVDFDAGANITTGNATASFSIETLSDYEGIANVTLPTNSAVLSINAEDPTAVKYLYSADDYSKYRVSYVLTQENNTTVYVNPDNEDYTVYIRA